MSSMPPLMPSSATPPLMSYSSTPNMMAANPASSGSSPDYGPVGKVPTGAGVAYFEESPETRNAWKLGVLGGGLVLLVGLILITFSRLKGFVAILAGVVTVIKGLWTKHKTNHLDVVCDGFGITLRRTNGSKRQPSKVLPWSKVTSTEWLLYRKTSYEGGSPGQSSPCFQFSIKEQAGPGIEIDETDLPKLEDLVAVVNAHTPQFSYCWVTAAPGMEPQLRVGKYARIAR